jgi:hypothetical protein
VAFCSTHAAAGIAGWYVFSQIQDQLAANEPVAVPNVVGLKEEAAVALIQDKGLEPDVQHAANADAEKDRVFDQNPNPGTRIQKGDRVTLLVSTGPPKTSVPDVVGMNYGDAVQALNDVNLKATKHEVFSQKPVGKVISQDPPAGEQVVEGTEIVLDVSRGAKQVAVPSVVGMSEDNAKTTLQQAGFAVSSTSAPSDSTQASSPTRAPTAVFRQPRAPPSGHDRRAARARRPCPTGGQTNRCNRRPEGERSRSTSRGLRPEQDNIVRIRRRRQTYGGTVSISVCKFWADGPSQVARAGARAARHLVASARSVVRPRPERYDVRAVAGRTGALSRGSGPDRQGRRMLPVPADGSPVRRRTWSSPSCTGPSARTARCRAFSSSRTSLTSAPASPPRRSAWTRISSRQ